VAFGAKSKERNKIDILIILGMLLQDKYTLIILVQLLLGSVIFGLLHCLVEQVASLAASLLNGGVDGRGVLLEERQNYLGVDDSGAVVVDGSHAPDHEQALAQPVEGNPASNEVSEVLQDGEKGEDHPVCEPLGVVPLSLGLEGLDGAVGGVRKTDPVSHQLSSEAKGQPGDGEANDSIGKVEPLYSTVFLQDFERVPNHSLLVDGFVELVRI